MAAMATITSCLSFQKTLGQQQAVVGRRPNCRQLFCTRRVSLQRNLIASLRAQASSSELAGAVDWGEPISLGTVKLPTDIDLQRLEVLLFQWGNSLTQNANLPLPVPLKVDKIQGGVRLGFIRLVNGVIEDLAHIDCVVFPGTKDSSPMFRALRNGQLKNQVPPGEPIIMQSLLQSLKKSIALSQS